MTVSDAVAAARAMMMVPEWQRPWLARRLLAEASAANAFRRAHGRGHPRWGDGTLMAAALRRQPEREPPLDTPGFREALIEVLVRIGQPRAQERQLGTAGSRSSRAGAISSPHSEQ